MIQQEMNRLNEALKRHSLDSPEYLHIIMELTKIWLTLIKENDRTRVQKKRQRKL